jgi:hypothetical protein
MPQELLSVTQTAERLGVSKKYVQVLVTKKRLELVHGEQFNAQAVDQLAQLMNKLRHNGIATLVEISAAQNNTEENN